MPSKKHKPDEKMENIEQGPPGAPEATEADNPAAETPVLISEAEVAQLQQELDQALKKSNEYLEGWQRERAEFFNYKKRMERDQSQGSQNVVGNAIRRYLDIADDLARALNNKNRPSEGEAATWADGIDLIYRKMLSAFEADGVMRMETDSKFFDPNLHEAISHEDSPSHESGQIIEVVQPGYTIGERVLRPARVRVAR